MSSEDFYRYKCRVFLRAKFQIPINQDIRICGNIPELGQWDPNHALLLKKDIISDFINPGWLNEDALLVPQEILFKCVIFENDKFLKWENLPYNRSFYIKPKTRRIFIHFFENKLEIIPSLNSKEDSSTLTHISSFKRGSSIFESSLEKKSSSQESSFDFENPPQMGDLYEEEKIENNNLLLLNKRISGKHNELKRTNFILEYFEKNKKDVIPHIKRKVKYDIPFIYGNLNLNWEENIFHSNSFFDNINAYFSSPKNSTMIITSLFMPISIIKTTDEKKFKIEENLNELGNLYLTLKRNKYKFIWFSIINTDEYDYNFFSNYLYSNYNIMVIGFQDKKFNEIMLFYTQIKNLFLNNPLDISDSNINVLKNPNSDLFDELSRQFAKLIVSTILDLNNSKVNINILNLNETLIKIPIIIKKSTYFSFKFANYFLNGFPIEQFLYFFGSYKKLLYDLLAFDLLLFENYEFARNFGLICQKEMGIETRFHKGHLFLDYEGRIIIIQCYSMNLDPEIYLSDKINEVENDTFFNILSIDKFENNDFFLSKLKIYENLLIEKAEKIKINILLNEEYPNKGYNRTELYEYIEKLNKNLVYGKIIIYFIDFLEWKEKIELIKRSNLLISLNIKETNYFYQKLYIVLNNNPIIMSLKPLKWSKCSFNFKSIDLKLCLLEIIEKLNFSSKQTKFSKSFDCIYLQNNSTSYFMMNFESSLRLFTYFDKKSIDIIPKNIEFEGETFKFIINSSPCEELSYQEVQYNYKKSSNRLFIINTDDFNLETDLNFYNVIKELSENIDNSIYLISSEKLDNINIRLKALDNIHIFSESGMIFYDEKNTINFMNKVDKWKDILKDNFLIKYIGLTPYSFLKESENSITFDCKYSDLELTFINLNFLGEELKDNLEKNENLEIIRRKTSIEIRTKDFHSGVAGCYAIFDFFHKKGEIDFLLTSCNKDEDLLFYIGKMISNKNCMNCFDDNFKRILLKIGSSQDIYSTAYLPSNNEFLKLLILLSES